MSSIKKAGLKNPARYPAQISHLLKQQQIILPG